MSWEKEVDELREQAEFTKEMGGADSVAFHLTGSSDHP